MKVHDIYNVISPFQDVLLIDSKKAEPFIPIGYLADTNCEFKNYGEYEIYGITPKMDEEGNLYLAIIVEMRN